MSRLCRMAFGLCVFSLMGAALAFNGNVVTEGPLKVTIAEVPDVTAYDAPCDVAVALKNSGGAPLAVRLRIDGLVDEWRAVGETEKWVEVGAGKEETAVFRIAAGKGACSALYPVHVYATFQNDGREVTAHAVQVFKSDFAKAIISAGAPGEMPVNVVPAHGALLLEPLRTQRVAWRYYDKPLVYMPVGWEGSVPESSANFSRQPVARGATKAAIHMHPPWKSGGGTVFAEYRLRLPETKAVKLVFSNAIRDNTEKEPKSDGVTFRVWVGEEKLFERHSDSKVWLDGEADMSRFAGQEVLLRLESDPGPNRNTTCDSSYWGEPTVVAGEPPARLTEAEREALRGRARKCVESRRASGKGEFVFTVGKECVAAVVLGKNGVADGAVAFGSGAQSVVFDGLCVAVLGHKVGQWPSQVLVREVKAERDWLFGTLKVAHRLSLPNEELDLTVEAWPEKDGLRVRVRCPQRITDLALGPADQKAPRVYYGHGYCIVEPEAFRASSGGHNLATSHVGFDFERGVSLLTACDNPPDCLDVNPEQRVYALHTHLDTMLTFVPSVKGAFDCATKYYPLFDKRPAGGVKRKAGRFVFDIWGGKYADIATTMERMIAYGLTDSLLTVHVWQRWGYDYRLPDIYPPDPRYGTVEDMRQIAKVCGSRDIPWGLHDNYIDFYPDAGGYSYDHICFTEQGAPIKAWINEGRDAQSYRWRPDRIMPFVKRNLALIKPNLIPSHYFIDVFTSAKCFDYYDREGKFHSMLETRKCWGETFAWIRDYLGGNAPTTSEAGHDQLIGYLDGADCQHLELSPKGGRFYNRVPCKEWERVPWFDAALHDKFSLHGVGYSGRYQGERPRDEHGIESDDYISAELLEGHALMIDYPAFGRGAVRKYWLAQEFIRSIALDRIERVEFVGGDIHRQVVTWRSGARVHVNRSDKDWEVEGRVLPQYGYLARNGEIESSIERIGGVIVEQSQGPGRRYVNGRSFALAAALPLRPTAERVEYLGERKFKMFVNWQADGPAPKDLSIFIHFNSEKSKRNDKIAFQGGGTPTPGTSTWKGKITTGGDRVVEVPEDCGAGEYEVTIGLWDPAGGKRYPLRGADDGGMRYRLGTLVVEGAGKDVKAIRLQKEEPVPEPPPRWNVAGKEIDFGPAVTKGAFRCEVSKGSVLITPLPDTPPCALTLRLSRLLGGKGGRAESLSEMDVDGKIVGAAQFRADGDAVTFTPREGGFAYRLALRRE